MSRLHRLQGPALLALLGCEAIQTPAVPPAPITFADLGEREQDRLTGVALDLFATVDASAGTEAGLRGFDDQLGLFAEPDLLARAREAERLRDELQHTSTRGLDLAHRLDREMLIAALTDLCREVRDRRPYRFDPGFALTRLRWCLRSLLDAEAVAPGQRFESMVARLRRMPKALEQARASLTAPSPRLAARALSMASGLSAMIREDLERFAAESGAGASLLQEYQDAARGAVAALATYQLQLREDLERKGIPEPYAGGPILLALLADTQGPEASLAQASIRGEAEVRRLRDALRSAILASHPGADLPAAVAALRTGAVGADAEAAVVAEMRDCVTRSRLLTWPAVTASAAATHRLHRFVSEAGHGRAEVRAVNAAQPALPRWATLQQSRAALGLVAARVSGLPGRVRRMLASRGMVEGLGEYLEQVLHEAGLWQDDPTANQGFLLSQLLSACRFVTAVRYHQGTMTAGEVAAWFRAQAWLDPDRAESEALQVVADPSVVTGFAGRMGLLTLRNELRERLGSGFRIQEFHDRLLALGAVPLAIARPTLLEELHVDDR